jgi:hypothetical protein
MLFINEKLRVEFPLVNIEKFLLMSFNEIDLLIGPKLCQLTSIWIENQIAKIKWCISTSWNNIIAGARSSIASLFESRSA